MHIPVLKKEVIEKINPKPNENFIDATIGEGGHTLDILEKNKPKGKVLAIEADKELYLKLKSKMKKFLFSENNPLGRLVLVNDSYVNLLEITKKEKFKQVSGIIFDLGLSNWHLEESGRGFSFKKNEPLDMRYSLSNQLTAEKIINYWSSINIAKIIREYGQEKKAQEIAERIIELRKDINIKTTSQLSKIISEAKADHQRVFQALRIAVNDELQNLIKAIPQALEILKGDGILAVISFHSLEDKIIKDFFREKSKTNEIKIITKKPITPSLEEIKFNPKSRSAKLRICKKN